MGSTEKETASVILDILDPVVNFVPTKINTDPSAIKVSTILFSPLNTSGEFFFIAHRLFAHHLMTSSIMFMGVSAEGLSMQWAAVLCVPSWFLNAPSKPSRWLNVHISSVAANSRNCGLAAESRKVILTPSGAYRLRSESALRVCPAGPLCKSVWHLTTDADLFYALVDIHS